MLETFDDDLDDEDSGEEDEDIKPELPPPLGQEAVAQTIQPMDGEVFFFFSADLSMLLTFFSMLLTESTRNLINTLFRLNSTASKVMKYYSKLIGSDYLVRVLGPVITDLCSLDDAMEVRFLSLFDLLC